MATPNNRKVLKTLLWVLLLLNIADVLTTIILLQSGSATEANPVQSMAIAHFGFGGIALVKFIPLSLAYLIVWKRSFEPSKFTVWIVGIAVMVYSILIVYSISLMIIIHQTVGLKVF